VKDQEFEKPIREQKATPEVPEGVDMSDPIEVGENIFGDISLVNSEEDLLNLTVRRIMELDEGDPIFVRIIMDLASKSKTKWHSKGDDVYLIKAYVKDNPAVFTYFPDLQKLRLDIKRKKQSKIRKLRRKRK
jgi:hypothetical protein